MSDIFIELERCLKQTFIRALSLSGIFAIIATSLLINGILSEWVFLVAWFIVITGDRGLDILVDYAKIKIKGKL